jgi:hypothetical protein
MRGSGREIRMVQIIGMYFERDEPAKQSLEDTGIVIDAPEEDRLT